MSSFSFPKILITLPIALVLHVWAPQSLNAQESKGSQTIIPYKVVSTDHSDNDSNRWGGFGLSLNVTSIPDKTELKKVTEDFMRTRKGDGVKIKIWMYLPGMKPGDESAFGVAQYSANGNLIDLHLTELESDQLKRIQTAMKKIKIQRNGGKK